MGQLNTLWLGLWASYANNGGYFIAVLCRGLTIPTTEVISQFFVSLVLLELTLGCVNGCAYVWGFFFVCVWGGGGGE